MSRRRQARELVLGCLYAVESTDQIPVIVFDDQAARQSLDTGTLAYARRLFMLAIEHGERIDNLIKERTKHWDFSRIGSVEKNILRAGITELWYCPETPALVVIDESVELAKDYAGEASGGFVNGILDWVYKHGDAKEPKPKPDSDSEDIEDVPVNSSDDTKESSGKA